MRAKTVRAIEAGSAGIGGFDHRVIACYRLHARLHPISLKVGRVALGARFALEFRKLRREMAWMA